MKTTNIKNKTYQHKNKLIHHHIQNGSGAHPASYPMGTRGSFPWGKAARA